MTMWIRTCQECGARRDSRPPASYAGDSWRNVKCSRCKSIALDYGHEVGPFNAYIDPQTGEDVQLDPDWDFGP